MTETRQQRRARERYEAKHPPQKAETTSPISSDQWVEAKLKRPRKAVAGGMPIGLALAAMGFLIGY